MAKFNAMEALCILYDDEESGDASDDELSDLCEDHDEYLDKIDGFIEISTFGYDNQNKLNENVVINSELHSTSSCMSFTSETVQNSTTFSKSAYLCQLIVGFLQHLHHIKFNNLFQPNQYQQVYFFQIQERQKVLTKATLILHYLKIAQVEVNL